jgi:hypothetical protein
MRRRRGTRSLQTVRTGRGEYVSIPFGRFRELPVEALAGRVVIDTNKLRSPG